MSESAFLFDDYFTSPEDKGVATVIRHKGRDLPFRIRRSITLHERQRANDAGVEVKLVDGTPQIKRMDQSAFIMEIAILALKSWPFTYPDGSPVPLNRKNISQLDGTLLEAIANSALGSSEVQEQAAIPFEMKSEEDSLQADQVIHA